MSVSTFTIRLDSLSNADIFLVVLGGDHPLGLPLIIELEQKGYIVITSVSTPEAVSSIESKGHGYVRALVLDPNEVCNYLSLLPKFIQQNTI